MKTKFAILLLLIMFFSLSNEILFFSIPAVSSNFSALSDSVSVLGTDVPTNVEVVRNVGNAINITGNIVISGNNVTRFAGLSPSMRATVYLDGSIEVRGNGTLILQYVTLYFIGASRDFDPFNRYIRLSNPSVGGHPRLIILNATIIAYTVKRITIGRTTHSVSAGCAIYAYGNSEISGQEFAFYRQTVSRTDANIGNRTVIKCYDESRVDLSYCTAESIYSYDNARVSISMGQGPRRTLSTDAGIIFGVNNSSNVNIYGVDFQEVTVSNNAYVSLKWCKEMTQGFLKTKDFARVDILDRSDLRGSLRIPAVNVTGNSHVNVNSSLITTSVKTYYAVIVMDNATFLVNNSTMTGKITSYNRSSIFLKNMPSPNALKQVWIEAHDFSNVSVHNCRISFGTKTPEIITYDFSRLSLVDSSVNYGWIRFFERSSVYISNSTFRYSQVLVDDFVNMTFADGSSFESSLELRRNSHLLVKSSSVMVLHGLGNSQITLSDSATVSMLYAKDNSTLRSFNSTIKELSFAAANVTGSWTGLSNFFVNSSFTLIGLSPDVILFNTYVKGLDVLLLGNSDVTIYNSTLRKIAVQGSSIARLYNASVPSESVSAVGNAKVYAWSYLPVKSLDYFGNPISGANTTVYSGSLIDAKKKIASVNATDDGLASFLLYSEMVNATGHFPFGEIMVRSRFGGISGSRVVSFSLTSEGVTLVLPLPSWTRHIFPVSVFVAIIAILAVIYVVIKKVRGRKS